MCCDFFSKILFVLFFEKKIWTPLFEQNFLVLGMIMISFTELSQKSHQSPLFQLNIRVKCCRNQLILLMAFLVHHLGRVMQLSVVAMYLALTAGTIRDSHTLAVNQRILMFHLIHHYTYPKVNISMVLDWKPQKIVITIIQIASLKREAVFTTN